MSNTLIDAPYMKFPFRIGNEGVHVSHRRDHIREIVEQTLFTSPGERVFRSDFGVGLRNLLFEPNNSALLDVAKMRIQSNLSDVLRGEVDPQTITVDIASDDASIFILVAYTISTINRAEQQTIVIPNAIV